MDINAGRNNGARNLKNAMAFGVLGGIQCSTTSSWKGKNAASFGGELKGDNGIHVKGGPSTFHDGLLIQNKPYTFEGNVWVQGNLIANSSSTTSKFMDKLYVDGHVRIQNNNSTPLFQDNVGIEGNLGFGGDPNTQMSGNNLWINGGFGNFDVNVPNATIGDIGANKLTFTNGGGTVYHTGDNFTTQMSDQITKVGGTTFDTNGNRTDVTFSKLDDTKIDSISVRMGLEKNIDERRDPVLDIDALIVAGANQYIGSDVATDGGNLSVSKLDSLYTKDSTDGNLHNGFLLVKVLPTCGSLGYYNPPYPAGCDQKTFNANPGKTTVFDKKVMFIVEDGATFNSGNGDFYNSGPNANTLIYVKPGTGASLESRCPPQAYPSTDGGKLQQVGSNNNFRGLIYVHPCNKQEHSLNFGNNSKIDGAVLMEGRGDVMWNTGGGDDPTVINYRTDILNAFAPGVASGNQLQFTNTNNQTIEFKAFGYYFY
jgi:hypothetical protein